MINACTSGIHEGPFARTVEAETRREDAVGLCIDGWSLVVRICRKLINNETESTIKLLPHISASMENQVNMILRLLRGDKHSGIKKKRKSLQKLCSYMNKNWTQNERQGP
jgi:hypothetical protein